MDILAPNSWLKKYLDTNGNPNEIAKYLSLSGPSVARIKKSEDGDYIYRYPAINALSPNFPHPPGSCHNN